MYEEDVDIIGNALKKMLPPKVNIEEKIKELFL